MKHITREDLIREYCQYVVEKMDEKTLKEIASVTLIANIKPESTYADWEDYVHRCLQNIQWRIYLH